MYAETRYFFIFQNTLGTTKNFRNRMDFFYFILQRVRYVQWNLLDLELFGDKSQVQRNGDAIACLFYTVKNKNSEAARLIVGTPLPFLVLSFSKCLVCVCVFCLFTPFLLVFFVFHRKKLVLLHLIYRYTTFTSE